MTDSSVPPPPPPPNRDRDEQNNPKPSTLQEKATSSIVDYDNESSNDQDTAMSEAEPPNAEPVTQQEAVDDSTTLHIAARDIDLAQMRNIFEDTNQAVDINAKTAQNGHTPLWDLVSAACEYDEQHEDAVTCLKLLISHGADVHSQALNGATPLHRCASSWCADTSHEIAQVLLAHGADPNANKTIKQSLDRGHDHDHDHDGCECGAHAGAVLSAAYKAATGHQLDTSQPKEELVTPICLAVGRNANLPMAKLLLEHGATININDPDAGTPLHLAASAGTEPKYHEIISLLLSQPEASALLAIPNNKHYLPIHLAAENYSPYISSASHEIIKLLIESGSPPDAPLPDSTPQQNRRGLTPLMLICQNAQGDEGSALETLSYLISRGADPNRKGQGRQTALLFAVISKNLPLVKFLAAQPGADIKAMSAAEEVAKPLYAAVIASHPGLVKWLVAEAGCPVDERDSDGYTALIHAAGYSKGDSAETVKVLVEELGADIEARMYDGRRALHFAAFKGQPNCARELVRLGADVKSVDDNGWTALHFAGRYHYAQVVKVLVDDNDGKGRGLVGMRVAGGPRPKMKDGEEIEIEGFNAADLAKVVRGGEETVRVLVERGEVLGGATRELKDEELWEDKGGSCCVM